VRLHFKNLATKFNCSSFILGAVLSTGALEHSLADLYNSY
jgi:hypothetical protein